MVVAPITHTEPSSSNAIEIPPRVKQRLGLDAEQSWIIVDEVNQFLYPGFDWAPVPEKAEQYAYGFLPPKLFDQIKAAIKETFAQKRGVLSNRDPK